MQYMLVLRNVLGHVLWNVGVTHGRWFKLQQSCNTCSYYSSSSSVSYGRRLCCWVRHSFSSYNIYLYCAGKSSVFPIRLSKCYIVCKVLLSQRVCSKLCFVLLGIKNWYLQNLIGGHLLGFYMLILTKCGQNYIQSAPPPSVPPISGLTKKRRYSETGGERGRALNNSTTVIAKNVRLFL